MYSNLVLSGGAFRGLGILGAIKYLEETDLIKNFKQYIGTSAGAIICFFLIIGYKSYEIKEIILNEINNIVKLSSFLAMGSGARGTPALFINEEFIGGYLPLDKLERMLR